MDPVPFAIAAVVAAALVTAIGALWRVVINNNREAKERDAKREAAAAQREAAAAERCEREIKQAVERIQFLENRSHQELSTVNGEQRVMVRQCLETMQECAAAIGSMVALEKTKQTASGTHPTITEGKS